MRQYEFELARTADEQRFADMARRVADLEAWRREHEQGHDEDEQDEVKQARESRRWRWQQAAAWMAVAAVLAAAWWQAAGTR